MIHGYATLFAFAVVGVLFAAVTLAAAYLFRPRVEDPIKRTTYECGMPAAGTTEVQTNIRFYVYALIFVIFEVETLFVYPWAVEARSLGAFAVVEMMIFLAILFLGLVYAWRKGALAWE